MALVVSAVLALLKIGVGIVGDSYALVADGVESVLDIFSGLLVLGGLIVVRKAERQEVSDAGVPEWRAAEH